MGIRRIIPFKWKKWLIRRNERGKMVNVFKSRMLWKFFVCWTWHVRMEGREVVLQLQFSRCEQYFEHFRPIRSALCISPSHLLLAIPSTFPCVSTVLFRSRKVRISPTKFFFLFNYSRFGKWKKKIFKWKKKRRNVRFVLNIARICCCLM